MPTNQAVTATIGPVPYRTSVRIGTHDVVMDVDPVLGGADVGPGPVDVMIGALCACVAMTVKMYAARKGWALEGVDVSATHEGHSPVTSIALTMEARGGLTAEQRGRLVEIAHACPVHKTLGSGVAIAMK